MAGRMDDGKRFRASASSSSLDDRPAGVVHHYWLRVATCTVALTGI
jgi:hypothetical protein